MEVSKVIKRFLQLAAKIEFWNTRHALRGNQSSRLYAYSSKIPNDNNIYPKRRMVRSVDR